MKIVDQKAEVGVIVARFQSPFLHEGHLEILTTVVNSHSRVLVFLGLSPLKCTFNNPYDFATRRAMLEEKFAGVEVFYIDDVGDNKLWSANLDRMISKQVAPTHKVVLYGSRDSFIKSYGGRYPTIEMVPSKFISASEIRKEAGIKVKHTLDFRLGVNHAVQNQYPSCKPTVDMAIVNFDTKELLLARKPNRELLQFPGGFLDPIEDKSAEGAAIRESKEETGLDVTVERYVGSMLSGDWRYRSEQDKIMTFLYVMRYKDGTPEAADDISFVTWKKFGEISEGDITDGHRPLIHMLNDNFNNEVLRLP